MADIDLQKKKPGAAPWIIGLLVLALLIWGVVELVDDDLDDDELVTAAEIDEPFAAAPAPQPAPAPELIPVAIVVTTPETYEGQTVSGSAQVGEVVSDRGFWIEQEGKRLFVVIDEPVPESIDINAGQMVQLSGTIYTPQTINEVRGQMEEQTRRVATGQPVFLYVRAADVRITDRPPANR